LLEAAERARTTILATHFAHRRRSKRLADWVNHGEAAGASEVGFHARGAKPAAKL